MGIIKLSECRLRLQRPLRLGSNTHCLLPSPHGYWRKLWQIRQTASLRTTSGHPMVGLWTRAAGGAIGLQSHEDAVFRRLEKVTALEWRPLFISARGLEPEQLSDHAFSILRLAHLIIFAKAFCAGAISTCEISGSVRIHSCRRPICRCMKATEGAT